VILPYTEQTALWDKLDKTGAKGVAAGSSLPHTGLVYKNGAATFNIYNGEAAAGVQISYMICPSSTLSPWGLGGTIVPGDRGVVSAMYTAISGAADPDPAVQAHPEVVDIVPSGEVEVQYNGIQSARGVLSGNVFRSFAEIRDGTSKTILIGEQSDWCLDSTGQQANCRSDWNHSFLMGAAPEAYRAGGKKDSRWFNTTSVRYAINHKLWNSPGIGQGFGCNRSIQSAHSGGAFVGMADGSVHFLSEDLDLQILYNLCNRGDGQATGAF
jgi:hypothetical protein